MAAVPTSTPSQPTGCVEPSVGGADPSEAATPSRLAVLDELARVLAGAAFAGALAPQRLLSHLVLQTLDGRGDELKETLLGIAVFRRPADRFDPRRDSIVRVEARRLRLRLRQHYEAEPGGPIMIALPTGSYRPQFVAAAPDAAQAQVAELVERGQFFLRQGHETGHRKALARFEQAAQAAPGHAAAHAGVARAWLQLVATNLEPPRAGVALALAAVRRALALQPAHADALVLAAQLTHRFEFDWPAARRLFEQALRVAPGSAYVHHALALSLMMRADFAAADIELVRARQHDPLHLGLRAHMALLHLYRRQWPAAADALRALLDMSADNVLGLSLLAYVALCQGDAASALAQYRQVARQHPGLSIGAVGEVQALAALGAVDAARSALDALVQAWHGRYLSPYQLAMAEVRLGQPRAAVALLRRAVEERDPNALCLPVDPAFDSLRGEADFRVLQQQVLGPAAGRGSPTPSVS